MKTLLCTLAALMFNAASLFAQNEPARPASFAEFLTARQDLAIVGTIVETPFEHQRKFEETCGTRGLMPLPVTEVKVAVEYVISGVVPDTVSLTVDNWGYFAKGEGLGRRVVAWGNRSCDDGWRIRGQLGLIHPDGTITGRYGMPIYPLSDGSWEVLSESTLSDGATFKRQPTALFEGTSAIAMARRIDHKTESDWTDDGIVLQVDSLGWVVGQGSHVPRYLKVARIAGCLPDIYPGDSLLVPVPVGFTGDTLSAGACPSSLRVQCGFAPGLGVHVGTQFDQAIVRIGTTLRVMHLRRGGD